MAPVELIDRGLLAGWQHAAHDHALLAGGRAVLALGRYLPTASLGAYEWIDGAIRADYCRQQGIAIIRRPSGGGALYLDPSQLTWSLFLPQEGAALAVLTARHSAAVVTALAELGVVAEFKAPNDLEVAGRKIASLFLYRGPQGVLLQGSLLLSVATETLLKVLRAPMEKLTATGVQSARQRFITLEECLGPVDLPSLQRQLGAALCRQFQLQARATSLPPLPPLPALEPLAPPEAADYAFLKGPGGVLHAWVASRGGVITALRLSGTIQLGPPDLLSRLEQALAGVRLERAVPQLEALLAEGPVEILGWVPEALAGVLARALARGGQRHQLGLDREQANSLMLHATDDPATTLAHASVMLVPYCAKPPDCTWRQRDGCPECGKCEVGDAYRLARERGMEVVTIVQFEHLRDTLEQMRAKGVAAYVGMCCQSFYLKRQYAFEAAGIPALLLDISGANCYELQQEDLAYAGRFEAQAYLNGEVVEKVMQWVPKVKRDDEG